MSAFRVINGCPCNARLAAYIALLVEETGTTVNSLYRGDDAADILHRHHHHTQAEIYASSPPGVANPPGRSTHELRSDGVAYAGPIGRRLDWWQNGVDVNDVDVGRMKAAARSHGWELFQPYPSSHVEFHHLNLKAIPHPPSLRTRLRLIRLRATLPRR